MSCSCVDIYLDTGSPRPGQVTSPCAWHGDTEAGSCQSRPGASTMEPGLNNTRTGEGASSPSAWPTSVLKLPQQCQSEVSSGPPTSRSHKGGNKAKYKTTNNYQQPIITFANNRASVQDLIVYTLCHDSRYK